MNGRPWTTTEARRLAELRTQRMQVKQIAIELNRTENAIYEFLRYVPARPGISAHKKPIDRRPPPVRIAKVRDDYWKRDELSLLIELASDGASAKDVAAALGRTESAVRSKAWLEGIRFSGRGKNKIFRLEQQTRQSRRDAKQGSAALLQALLAMAA